MALTSNVFNTKTSNFGFGTSTSALANHYAPSNFNLSKAGIQTGVKTGNFSFGAKQTYSQRRQALGQDRLDAINNATSLDNLNKPKYTVGAGKGNYTAQKQAYQAKMQEFNPTKQSEWSKGAEGKWGTALAGFDSAVNLTNSVMNWVNMGKQWDYMNKSMELANKQFETENARYNARETERINNNNSIRGAIESYYTNRANSSAMSADSQAAQAKAAQTQNAQNPQNNTQGGEQAPQDEEKKPLPMERE